MKAYKDCRKLSHLKSNTGQFTEANESAMQAKHGNCDACGDYDTELLDFGEYSFCRDVDCERVRQYVDAALGFRIKGPNGDIVLIRTEEALKVSVPKYKQAIKDIREGRGLGNVTGV